MEEATVADEATVVDATGFFMGTANMLTGEHEPPLSS